MKLIAPSVAVVNQPAKVEGLDNESLYAAWTTHFALNQNDVRELLPTRLLARPIFAHLVNPGPDLAVIAKAIGSTPKEVLQLRGVDIGGASDVPSAVLFPSLRYCRRCIEMGYHSIMFQHVAIACCPLHNEALQETCRDCGNLIEPTFVSATESPFECPTCTSRLAHTVIDGASQQHGKWVDQMLGARRRVLANGVDPAHQARRLGDVPLRLRSAGSPAASRHYQRVCVWAYPHDSHWISFREQTHPVNRGPARDVPLRTWLQLSALQLATLSILQWLIEACWMHENAALRLLGRLGRYPRGLRLNAHTSVVSVALYKVAAAYDLLAEMKLITQLRESGEAVSAMAMSSKEVVRFGDSLWEDPQLDARLLQLEVLGLFAKLLVQEGGKCFLDEVSWLEYPHPIEFAPSWHIESRGRAPVARVRYRAAELDVERLLKRFWSRALRFRHHDPVGSDEMWKHNHLDSLWHECEPPEALISLQRGEARRL